MNTPPPASSFSSSEGHSNSSVDLNKKRKLKDDESDIPGISSPKQRFRIRKGFSEEPTVREIELRDAFDQPEESEKDSNTFIDASDSSMSSDAKGSNENSIAPTVHQSQPSSSTNSYGSEALKTHLYSLESRGTKELKNVASGDLEETFQFDSGNEAMEDLYSSFGLDHPVAELATEADAGTETMILYSDDVAPHPFMHSSGWWNLGEGALLGGKGLTIDQEFEQYFSSLLL